MHFHDEIFKYNDICKITMQSYDISEINKMFSGKFTQI